MDVKKPYILFISYDGLTDPLGQSQILPYIIGLAKADYKMSVLSFEKKEGLLKNESTIKKICALHGITWHQLPYTNSIPVLSKVYDKWQMKKKVLQLYKKNKYHALHCRSYISAEFGMLIKKQFGAKFIFDMRGFWADEKKDGGAWNVKNPIFNYIYNYYKNKEKQYIQNADAIVSLTHAAKKIIEQWPFYKSSTPIYVVPCSVDTNHFQLVTDDKKNNAKQSLLNIPTNAFVLSYLGALGSWYCLDEMLQLFKKISEIKPNALFLILSHTNKNYILDTIKKHTLNPANFIIKEVSRNDVPKYLAASDVNVSFIRPVYSKIASSPTKLGEVLAMGIPVITNSGVGDVAEMVNAIGGSIVIDSFDNEVLDNAVAQLHTLEHPNHQSIRNNTMQLLSLEKAVETYRLLYKQLL
jgi:glycosyltransferase involved in cell wall biosynthesis